MTDVVRSRDFDHAGAGEPFAPTPAEGRDFFVYVTGAPAFVQESSVC